MKQKRKNGKCYQDGGMVEEQKKSKGLKGNAFAKIAKRRYEKQKAKNEMYDKKTKERQKGKVKEV